MMRSMFGNSVYHPSLIDSALSGLRISWLCHFIGRCPMLADNALSGLLHHSPERAKYINEAVTPLATNDSETVTTPLATNDSETVTTPLATNDNEAVTPLGTNDSETVTTPLAKYISEAVTPLTIKKRLF